MSLKNHIDGHYIASEVLLIKDYRAYRAYRRKSTDITYFLLVEGTDDERVYSRFISDHCEIMVCYGKRNLKEALECLERWDRRFNRYLGIMDSDFDNLKTNQRRHRNLIPTDGHDLEVMTLKYALDDLLDEYLKGKEKESVDNFKGLLKKRLFALGSKIGYLRMNLYDCEIRDTSTFKIFDFLTVRYLEKLNSKCELSPTDAINVVKDNYPKFDESQIPIRKLKKELKKLRKENADNLCHGKDMIEILYVIFPKLTEKYFGKEIGLPNRGYFKKQLFETFDQPHFKKTRLYKQIKEWEANNKPYLVLKE